MAQIMRGCDNIPPFCWFVLLLVCVENNRLFVWMNSAEKLLVDLIVCAGDSLVCLKVVLSVDLKCE